MATTQQVTHFDLSPDFDVLVRPAHGGDMLTDPGGWQHYAWHVLIMCRDESLTFTYRTGTGATEHDETTYAPIIPPAIDVVRTMVIDLEPATSMDLADFLTEYGYEDIRKGISHWEASERFFTDMKRLFPLHIQHFIDTYRED